MLKLEDFKSTKNTNPQFFKSKSAASSDTSVILERGAVDDRPQRSCHRFRHDRRRLLLTVVASTLFASRLVKPASDKPLPVLVKVSVGNHVVSLPHLSESVINQKRHKNLHNKHTVATAIIQSSQTGRFAY